MAGARALARGEAGPGVPRHALPGDIHHLVWWARHTLWLLPVLGALLGAFLGVLMVHPPEPLASVLRGVAWLASVQEARSMLSSVLGIALSSLSIVLSLSMLVVQNAAGQYSPRLLRLYLHSAGVRVVIPMFVATSVFCLVAAQSFGFIPGDARLPRPALSLAMLLLVLCEAALIFHVLETLQFMRVENLVREVGRDTLRVARRMAARCQEDLSPAPVPPPSSSTTWPLRARASGFVADVDGRRLLAVAQTLGLVVHVDVAIGEPVTRGAVVGRVEPGGRGPAESREVAEALLPALLMDRWRDLDSDVALGVRQLVDVAIKALSPGINDPYTAVEVVDQLTFLLCAMSQLRLGPRVLPDASGHPRVFLHAASLRDYLSLATDQILRYGAGEPAVVLRLLRLTGEVGQRARSPEDRHAARQTLRQIQAGAERALEGAPWRERLRGYTEAVERAMEGGPLPALPAIGF
ncbi:DUF2254 domain-containing protein [Pyxidicoccus fallax]|uniref:DUF2254 domain-containing protein n=1 Tax=Pyxidicoccus fallax TaxID=394095 RepID=A0A848LAP0_9BACT|nr:DUF2254 domain-containing protein [Pyxidicoccus fallax]NMO13391.1 DUF2254 domain-containing protein [Pyxidicoccus fallax]NPC80300.1 DUF2254 domain-containing protein [Pyxidicoccus fallax]